MSGHSKSIASCKAELMNDTLASPSPARCCSRSMISMRWILSKKRLSLTSHFASLIVLGVSVQEEPQPLSVPPSEYWDGNDGSWSTFHMNVGTPAQLVRLLPGTSATAGDSIWVILPEGCYIANPQIDESVCENSRGNVFARNQSTTFATSRLANGGLYGLDTFEEQRLGLDGNAYYGFDTISFLGGRATLTEHLVAGIATDDFWIGSLGLSPLPINFTSINDPVPSLLGALRNTSIVPSTSWAYTAGASYNDPPVFGSLVFGGYDAARMQDSGLSLPFWSDQSRDLLVGLQSITYDTLGSNPLMTTGVYAFMDSIVTHMWLPLEVCQAFEQAFGLVWDEASELYLLNSSTHARLQAQNPTFTFTLAATLDDSGDSPNTTVITMPYSAFDLNVSQPLVNATTPYFPLKRAQNSTQYTLGRVFFQEAYVIADYDRRNFTVGQAALPSTADQDLRAILPPGVHIEHKRNTLSPGAIAGIAVEIVLALLLVGGTAYWLWRRKKTVLRPEDVVNSEEVKVEQSGSLRSDHYHEADSLQVHEAHGSSSFPKPRELPVSEVFRRAELGDERWPTTTYELPGEGIAAAEMH